jgi:carbon monoxide dehydrogenase subunit G
MDIHGEQLLSADRSRVWNMLNDPEILRECIPGCEALVAEKENEMAAIVAIKIGPIKARFSGKVQLVNIVAPASYSIVGEGKAGIAGFAKGVADVTLEEHPEGTLLLYKVDVAIGGKLAQLGSRLIESTSRKLSEQFFEKFAARAAASAEAM